MSLRSLKNSITLLAVSLTLWAPGQQISTFDLPEILNEISGLERLNDTTLIAINDGGNSASVFLLNMDGSLRNSVDVTNVQNHDWEDLTRDKDYLYIADIGNNLNKRKNLTILKLKISELNTQKEVRAEKINIRYTEQTAYPPEKDSLFFDAESIAADGDSLVIITKNRVSPWDGNAMIYKVSKDPGSYNLKASARLNIGSRSWRSDSATAMDIYKGKWYVLTYGKLLVYSLDGGQLILEHTFKFRKFTQKESVVLTEDSIFVADEKHKLLGGGKLYRIDP